ncbi:SRPBCC family protein [Pseudonocardia xishanensis]|uniref:SRPBCC family protein n=1 Tax=Pseudonocardia xishanensis TaxID=630995 RepID=A0ABP8RTS8_9PSEU
MSVTVERRIPASPERVFAVLADGWSYPLWVVGATHMRVVDEGFPAVGTRLHHSVGSWPLQLEDDTEVLAMQEGELLELRGHAWPSGSARIRIEVHRDGDGSLVVMTERAEQGPATVIPGLVQQAMLTPRNRESLARLAAVVCERG